MSELELVSKLVKKLKRDGYRVRTEVSNMGQSADIVATRGKWVTLIEVKKSNWSRALQQCLAHELVADFICVAIASVAVPQRLAEIATAMGYGVLQYDPERANFIWIIKPRRNKQVWAAQRRHWAKEQRRVVYGN